MLCFDACYYGSPLPGINYRGVLTESQSHFEFADRFADELARETGFAKVDATQTTRETDVPSSRSVFLRGTPKEHRMWVTITVYTQKQSF